MAKFSFSPVSRLAQAGLSKLSQGIKQSTDSVADEAGKSISSSINAIGTGLSTFLLLLGGLTIPLAFVVAIFAGLGGILALSTITTSSTTPAAFFSRGGDEAGEPTEFIPPGESESASLTKTVLATEIPLGPSNSIQFGNDKLPEPLQFEVKVKAKTDLTNVTCTDNLTLTKKGSAPQNIPVPSPSCPPSMTAGQEYNFSFTITADSPQYNDSLVTNIFTLNGNGQSSVSNLNYYIPFRDTTVEVINEATLKNIVATNPSWLNNFVNTECEPGLSCWDYVKRESIAGGVNPAFTLAVWIAESGASHFSGHLSCPNGGVGLSHTIDDLKRSVACFVDDVANNFPADQFPQMIDAFCDPATPEICQTPPNPPKTFLNSLKSWYNNLVPPGNFGALTEIAPGSTAPFSISATATVVIGNAAPNCFNFTGNWTIFEMATENAAIALISQSTSFINELCSGENITLNRVNAPFNTVTCPNTINITSQGIGSLKQTTYTLTHESGHILQCRGHPSYQQYLNAKPYNSEGFICSYPFASILGSNQANWPPEDYAEMIGIYPVWRNWPTALCGVINYPAQYPQHYNFAKSQLFGGFEY